MTIMHQMSEDLSPGSDQSGGQLEYQEMFDRRALHDIASLPSNGQQAQEEEFEHQQEYHQNQPHMHQHHQQQHHFQHPHNPYMEMQQRRRSPVQSYPGHPTWHMARPHPHFVANYGNPYFAQQHHQGMMSSHGHKHVTDTKPRFAKHEVEVLEAEFQKNHKPSSIIKRALAAKMAVEVPRINNWFQNRRAREKHDAKLKEYERQQREEQNKDSASSSSVSPSAKNPRESCSDDKVATENADCRQSQHRVTISTAMMGDDDGPADVEDESLLYDDQQVSLSSSCDEVSESASTDASPVVVQDAGFTPASELGDFDFGRSGDYQGQGQAHGHFASPVLVVQDSSNMFLTPFSQQNSQARELQTAPYVHFHVPTFPSDPYLDDTTPMPLNANQHFNDDEYPFKSEPLSTMSMSQPSPPSPPPTVETGVLSGRPQRTIAERRRQQRPAELRDFASVKASRVQGPRTGIDMGRRLEHPAPMRRTASATGMYPLGISKSSAGSSYNVKQESLLAGLRAPGSTAQLTSLNTAFSPVSPRDRELTPATMSSSDDHYAHFVKCEPYAIHTPPKTPGLHINLEPHTFSMSAEDYHGLDGPLLTPGLVQDGSELDFSGSNASGYHRVPRYAASQPVTPGLAPHHFGSGYMWGPQPSNNAPEYRFPDSSSCYMDASARSSPGAHMATPVNFHFAQNVTPQDFRAEF